MECRGCGGRIPDDSTFCQYCGYVITEQKNPGQQHAQAKTDMSAGMIVAIVIVALAFAGAVFSAVMLAVTPSPSFGNGHEITTPMATYQKAPVIVTNGVQVNIVSITKTDVPWSDVKVLLTDGTNFTEWSPLTKNLDGGSPIHSNLTAAGATALGGIAVFCNVIDVSGNGFVSGSDYIRVNTETGQTGFSSATVYTLVLVYELTGERIGTGQLFTG